MTLGVQRGFFDVVTSESGALYGIINRTANPDIFRVSEGAVNMGEPLETIPPELAAVADGGDPEAIRVALQRWIPTFNMTMCEIGV